ncbi:MAG: hypothetical protein J1G38_04770 [Clostridiales bacterium]|nr:hypothetical protein [Clostridiales bacterium]
MDCSDNHPPSKVPIAVSIQSEREPVDCDGYFTALDSGFVLEFGTPSGRYEITHEANKTRLVSTGLLSYAMDFSDGGATEVAAPFGGINFSLTPLKRVVDVNADGVKIELCYKLVGAGAETLRAVNVNARFLR